MLALALFGERVIIRSGFILHPASSVQHACLCNKCAFAACVFLCPACAVWGHPSAQVWPIHLSAAHPTPCRVLSRQAQHSLSSMGSFTRQVTGCSYVCQPWTPRACNFHATAQFPRCVNAHFAWCYPAFRGQSMSCKAQSHFSMRCTLHEGRCKQ